MTASTTTVTAGEQFGALTVLATDLLQASATPAVLCECVCGRHRLTGQERLTSGEVTSCIRGCAARRTAPSAPTPEPPAPAPEQGRSHVVRDEEPSEPRRRSGRSPSPIPGLDRFQPLVDEFLVAAMMDVGLATAICESATRILRKRLQWSIRSELREAEANAQADCALSDLTSCEIQNPCGTGSQCPFAAPALVHLDVPAEPVGKHATKTRAKRPQPRRGDGYWYTIEAAMPVLLEERADLPPDTRTKYERAKDAAVSP